MIAVAPISGSTPTWALIVIFGGAAFCIGMLLFAYFKSR
jgi:hypothetical protein